MGFYHHIATIPHALMLVLLSGRIVGSPTIKASEALPTETGSNG